MERKIDKELALSLMQTLSALEALALACGKTLPMIARDYLLDQIGEQLTKLKEIVLQGE